MVPLARRRCVPCRGGVPPLGTDEIAPLHAQIPAWQVRASRRLERHFRFRDFAAAWQFLDRIGALAEEEWHHPDLHLAWGSLRVELWTHAIDGLSESDFVLAAKIDELWRDAVGRVV
jgi:4a-hydroxytetrahydrobiopterin dehydratase